MAKIALLFMRTGPILTSLAILLLSCQDDAVRGPKEWQVIAQQEMTERLRTRYDEVYDDVDAGFIKARVGRRLDVYDVVDGKVERFFSRENGEGQGYSFEWYPDGALWFADKEVNGELEGTAVEFNHERGLQYMREYHHGEQISLDSVPLTDRPRISLFAPPQVTGPAN